MISKIEVAARQIYSFDYGIVCILPRRRVLNKEHGHEVDSNSMLTQLKIYEAKPGGRQAEDEAISKGPALCLIWSFSEYLLN